MYIMIEKNLKRTRIEVLDNVILINKHKIVANTLDFIYKFTLICKEWQKELKAPYITDGVRVYIKYGNNEYNFENKLPTNFNLLEKMIENLYV